MTLVRSLKTRKCYVHDLHNERRHQNLQENKCEGRVESADFTRSIKQGLQVRMDTFGKEKKNIINIFLKLKLIYV